MDRDRMLWIVLGVIAVGCAILMYNNDAGASLGIENNQFASLVYLGTFGLVIGSFVLGRGLPTGHIVRQAGAWLCIILALMVAYELLATYNMLPENFAPRVVPRPDPDSGTGVSASLMDGVDRVLHL